MYADDTVTYIHANIVFQVAGILTRSMGPIVEWLQYFSLNQTV